MNRYVTSRWHDVLGAGFAAMAFLAAAVAPAVHGAEHETPAGEPPNRFRVADFERAGVTLGTAGQGVVDFAIDLPGEVRPNADRTAHLAPRFAGTVREVRVSLGDHVRAGDVLAVLESDTLARYEMRAPFDGVVVDKHVVPGETVDRSMTTLIIADLATVWIEVSVYQEDLADVRPGRAVRVAAGGGIPDADATISYVSPIVDQVTRTATARAVLANPDGVWRPGLFVAAHILEPHAAAVVIPRAALQQHEGRPVLFVVVADGFEARRVTLGRVGRTTAEVLAGVTPGERYAATHSFLIKAELEKGEAGEADEH